MGRRARLKKQLKLERILQQKEQVAVRSATVRQPIIRLVKLTIVALFLTVALLYVGRIVNQRIVETDNISEATG